MKPVNQKERNNLYLQFLLFYIVSLVVVIIAVGFFYEVNDKEIQVLRDQKEKFKAFEKAPVEMNEKIQKLDSLLKALEDPKTSQDMVKSEITKVLDKIPSLDSEHQGSMDTLVHKVREKYYSILEFAQNSRNNAESVDAVKRIQAELEQMKKDLEQCQKDYDKYVTLHPN